MVLSNSAFDTYFLLWYSLSKYFDGIKNFRYTLDNTILVTESFGNLLCIFSHCRSFMAFKLNILKEIIN